MNIYENSDKRVPIELDNPSIKRDNSKCILCGACKSVCKFSQGVYGNYDVGNTKEAICINCGQCLLVCPTNAITEVKDYQKVKEKILDDDYIVIFQTAPSVRVALGEKFGLNPGDFVEGKMVSALKKIGADYVFDTTFGADLTIMEEANELVDRIINNKTLPQFTSCCPAWVKFVEIFHPELIPNLSTARSPILMQGPIIKTYFANKMNINPEKIINVAVAPCTAKKYEITRNFHAVKDYYGIDIKDMDYIITTNELAEWIKEENIDFNDLEDSNYDDLFLGSGAGYIFGNSGGVMESAVRTAYNIITGENPKEDLLNFKEVRGVDGIKEATLNIANKTLNLAIISGTNNVNRLLKKIKEENLKYDFIEVMACPGGCIAGGGQPKTEIPVTNTIREKRMQGLYNKDNNLSIRTSYQNENINKLYDEFLGNVLSDKSRQLLHTYYEDKSELLNTKQTN